jgi:hypothetical protein
MACFAAVTACKNVAPDFDQSAVIVDPDDASRAALQRTVNAVLGTEVLLADDALTGASLLVIERNPPRSIDGAPAQGRNMGTPVQLRLVSDDSQCILVDQRDGSRHVLENTSCVAEEQGR